MTADRVKIEAVVFDMDGLLIDSEPFWRLAEQEIFRSVGLELSEAQCLETTGLRIDEVVEYWFERSPWATVDFAADRSRLAGAIVVRVEELVRQRGVPMAGVRETLLAVHRSELAVALATSSSRSLIRAVFDMLERELSIDCGELFEVVCTATEERNGKPSPDVYLTTAKALGVAEARCLALEDSVAGVESALAAGMKVVAVPAAEARQNVGFDRADRVLSSLGEFSLALLTELD